LTRRPEMTLDEVLALFPHAGNNGFSPEVRRLAQIRIKYEGYIDRQLEYIERFRKMEGKRIPDDFNYAELTSLSYEGRLNLQKIRPGSLGASSRIFGVTPADIAVLAIALKKRHVPHGT